MQNLLQIVNSSQLKQQKLLQNTSIRNYLNQIIIGLLYGQQYLKEKNYSINKTTSFNLPALSAEKKGTILLDLDETLMTTNLNKFPAQYSIKIDSTEINFSIRPFARELLQILSRSYEILIFTASKIEYASQILSYIDPQHQYVNGILDRSYCYQTENGIYVKDIRTLTNRNIDQIILVDNSPLSFCFQPQNGVPVSSWLGDPNDRELEILAIYLAKIMESNNLRQANYDNLKFPKLLEIYTKNNF